MVNEGGTELELGVIAEVVVAVDVPLVEDDKDEEVELKEVVGVPDENPEVDVPTVEEVTDEDIGEGTPKPVVESDVDSARDVFVVEGKKTEEKDVPEVELELELG